MANYKYVYILVRDFSNVIFSGILQLFVNLKKIPLGPFEFYGNVWNVDDLYYFKQELYPPIVLITSNVTYNEDLFIQFNLENYVINEPGKCLYE